MISLLEKLHLNKKEVTTQIIIDSPLKASLKIRRLQRDNKIDYYICRMPDNMYAYGVNDGYKVGDKLDDGSIVIEIQKA